MNATEIITTTIIALIGGMSPIIVELIKINAASKKDKQNDTPEGILVPPNWKYSSSSKRFTFNWQWIIILTLIGGLAGYTLSSSINRDPTLKIVWTSDDQIKVSWRNLPPKDGLYLMKYDGNRYYDPEPISISNAVAGNRIVTISSGITEIVIGVLPKNITPSNFPTNGIELGDTKTSIEIQIQKSIPPK